MNLILTEKPSVAMQYAKALKLNTTRHDGYIESKNTIITWCVGHLIAMSYPEKYDAGMKKWSLDTLPFIPDTYKYETIKTVSKQFKVVKSLFERSDIDTIYFAGDSAREGEYIGRLVLQQCNKSKTKGKKMYRVWIDSQTDDEIKRGLKEAKPLSAYDNLSDSAYCRAKEDYLIGINFSRALTLTKAQALKKQLNMNYKDKCSISVGRVMTCVLGMVIEREREIRNFKKDIYYKVNAICDDVALEWLSKDKNNPALYNERGFKEKDDAQALIGSLGNSGIISKLDRKKQKKNAPLLYNLAELQNDCSKLFKISPDETLNIVQELYEKKLVTYPRTDARVLSSAVAKEINRNLKGIAEYTPLSKSANYILDNGLYQGIEKKKYVDDSKISDHYAIIPTGQALSELSNMSNLHNQVYDLIARRLISIFLPSAEYEKVVVEAEISGHTFDLKASFLASKGFLGLYPNQCKGNDEKVAKWLSDKATGDTISVSDYAIKEAETKPPTRYNSGSLILAMENAGKLIEDEELREQIKTCGIGTSATRAETLKKLVKIKYLTLNKKTQIITPTKMGEGIYDIVKQSLPSMLRPDFTASWEKGLNQVADGTIKEELFMQKLNTYVRNSINTLKGVK